MRALVLILAAIFSTTANAQLAPITWTFETQVWSKYVGADLGKVLYSGPGQQSSLTAAFKNGCYANIWYWRTYRTSRDGNYSEVDYTLGCGIPLAPSWKLNVAISYFDLPLQFKSAGDIVTGVVGVEKSWTSGAHTFTAYANVKPAFVIGYPSGSWNEVGLADLWKLTDRLSLSFGGRVLYDTGIYGNTAGWNARGDAIAIVHLAPNLELKGGLRGFLPLSHYDDALDYRRKELVFWSGISTTW